MENTFIPPGSIYSKVRYFVNGFADKRVASQSQQIIGLRGITLIPSQSYRYGSYIAVGLVLNLFIHL